MWCGVVVFLTDNNTTPTKVVLSCFGLLVWLWQFHYTWRRKPPKVKYAGPGEGGPTNYQPPWESSHQCIDSAKSKRCSPEKRWSGKTLFLGAMVGRTKTVALCEDRPPLINEHLLNAWQSLHIRILYNHGWLIATGLFSPLSKGILSICTISTKHWHLAEKTQAWHFSLEMSRQ